MNTLLKILLSPEPLMRNMTRTLLLKVPALQRVLTIDERILHAVVPRPHYAYSMLQGARLARRMGFKRTTIIEFGVAGGSGLVTAEALAPAIERETGIALDIFGFDMGSGMPVAKDYRDMSYVWKPGFFVMDEGVLRAKLSRAHLVLGPLAETVPTTITAARFRESPISAIIFDVDYYSSTIDAFKAFTAPSETRLPRVMCYMDDVLGGEEWYSDFTGVRGAVAEFNRIHGEMKISPLYLSGVADRRLRSSQLMMLHDFAHSNYNVFVGNEADQGQLPLSLKLSA